MEKRRITFNKPYITGRETEFIADAVAQLKLSGNGKYSKLCHEFFETRYGFKKCLLSTSCTDALEMAAMLIDIQPGDEVIVPSYTFVSTALAFARQGAKIVFIDSMEGHPNMNAELLEGLITERTKAIVPVHYAGIACDMDRIMEIAHTHGIFVIEDAAQGIDSYYNGKALGSIGHLGCFSFHETKNIQCGEGGMLAINDERFLERSEIIWEKGTNRAQFFRGEINKYSWVDTGSSFLPSDILAAFLYAQLVQMDDIQAKRRHIWERYDLNLRGLKGILRPCWPEYATNPAHMYYLLFPGLEARSYYIDEMKKLGIDPVFHYLSLHNSEYIKKQQHQQVELPNSDAFADRLVRLPFYFELSNTQVDEICENTIQICNESISSFTA